MGKRILFSVNKYRWSGSDSTKLKAENYKKSRYLANENKIELIGLKETVEDAKQVLDTHCQYYSVYKEMDNELAAIDGEFFELDDQWGRGGGRGAGYGGGYGSGGGYNGGGYSGGAERMAGGKGKGRIGGGNKGGGKGGKW